MKCASAEDFYATMNDVARGGIGLHSRVPLIVGQRSPLSSPWALCRGRSRLRGVTEHTDQGLDGIHRSGLRFKPFRGEEQVQLDQLIQWMLR